MISNPLLPESLHLDQLYQAGLVKKIDLFLAKAWLPDALFDTESFQLLYIFMHIAQRQGHTCLHFNLEEHKIYPSPGQILKQQQLELKGELIQQDFDALNDILLEAFLKIETLIEKTKMAAKPLPFIVEGSSLFFSKFWEIELHLSQNIFRHAQQQPWPLFAEEKVELPENLDSLQKKILHQALNKGVMILTGGPGTGKTFLAKHLIKLFIKLSQNNTQKFKIALAAPTGKAIKNLEQQLGEFASSCMCSETLHQLLKPNLINLAKNEVILPLNYDLILVDEASMIDSELFYLLTASLKKHSRLLLLGDPHQLPPVESGQVFSDLVHFTRQNPNYIHLAELQKCYRTKSEKLNELYTAIKQQEVKKVESLFFSKCADINFQDTKDLDKSQILQAFLSFYETPLSTLKISSACDFLKFYTQYKILCPLKKGFLGLEKVNLYLNQRLQAQVRWKNAYVCPIILNKTNKDLNLFNGDFGILIYFNSFFKYNLPDNYALFSKDNGISLQKIPQSLLPDFDLAYCLSVHKSQGSEFENTLVNLPPGSEVFGNEILYTAVTRTKKSLSLLSSWQQIKKIICSKDQRATGLGQQLTSCFFDKPI